MSIARNHREKILAQQAAETASKNGQSMDGATQYELMLAKLGRDKSQLKAISSQLAKNEKKVELLPDYQGYIDGVLVSDAGVQDDCLATLMLWHIDCLQFDRALEIAEYCIKHKIQMPENFTRDLVTVMTEQIAEEAIKNPDANMLDQLKHLAELTTDQDMLDEVRAKLFKAIGIRLEETDPELAQNYLQQALKYNDKSGVKTLMTKLKNKLTT